MTEPILERIERLRSQWYGFVAEDAPRLLHWVIDHDEWRLLDSFLTIESSEASETGDLFLAIDVPFGDPLAYAGDLARWIAREYEVIRPVLESEGIDTDWDPGEVVTVDDLLRALRSFHEHHQPLFEHVAIVLLPTRVDDGAAWTGWLGELLGREGAPEVRFVAIDYAESLALAELARLHAGRVRTVVADLDVMAAYIETSERAGGLDRPAGAFRHGYLQMCVAAGEGRMTEAESLAPHVEEIARGQGWLHLVFAVRFAMGSGYLQAEDHAKAIQAYRAAEQSAVEMETAGEDFGPGLRLKALLGQGGVCVAAGAWDHGAEAYERALVVAEETEDVNMALECHRMASYCHEQAGRIDEAFAHASGALGIARAMTPEARAHTTLPFVGQALERLTRDRKHARWAEPLEAEMCALLGDDWRSLARPGDVPEPQPVAAAEAG